MIKFQRGMLFLKQKTQRSFTLIELITAMGLMVIVAGILASIIATNLNILDQISDRKKAVTSGMLAIDLFQRELAMLTDSTNIVVAKDQELEFNDNFGNTWEYLVTSNTFTRREVGVGSAMTLATPVINAGTKFTYYKSDNSVVSTPASATDLKLIRLVKLVLTMDDGYEGVTLMASVYPENLSVYNKAEVD